MGAQNSVPSYMKGPIRLRRRAPTMGITTSAELQSAGVDVESAVHLAEEHLKAAALKAAGAAPIGKPVQVLSATCPVPPAYKLSSDPKPQTPGTPPQRVHPSAAALQVELPPWEVVASLGESEWFAFKAWIEAGWKCKHCGHVRDDHADHPRAVKLLAQCGVAVPGLKTALGSSPQTQPQGAARPFSPSNAQAGVMNYGSESTDVQMGYLSDQTSRSAGSGSRGSSPGRAQVPVVGPSAGMTPPPLPAGNKGAAGGPHTGRPESPRFHDSEGKKHLAFPAHLQEVEEEVMHSQDEGRSHLAGHRSNSGPMEHKYDLDGNALPEEPSRKQHRDEHLGPEACPHLAALGLVTDMPGGVPHAHHQTPAHQDGAGSWKEHHPSPSGGGPPLGPHSHLPDAILKKQEEEISLAHKIMRAVTRANQIYFIDKEPNGTLVFDYLLSALLDVTNSPYGFISSALLKADGTPYLKTHAISNLAWNKELKAWYAANAHKGLVFTNLNSLHGSIVYTGQPVISNDVPNDPRSKGLPEGHPPIDRFMGIPLFTGSELIGLYGVANCPEEYTEQLLHSLEPLTLTIAQMMYAVNERKRRKEAELQLSTVVQIASEGIMSMSYTGQITSINMAAREMFGHLPKSMSNPPNALTGEETALSTDLQMQVLIPEIDGRSNYLKRGLEHQEGHRHRGLGRRSDGSIFPVEVAIAKGIYGTVFYVAVVRDLTQELNMKVKLEACICGQGPAPARDRDREQQPEDSPAGGAIPAVWQ